MGESSDTASRDPAPREIDALFAEVYDRLKAMAGRQLAKGARGTLNTTGLVHDLYLRLGSGQDLAFEHANQFFAYAARAMRHLLMDRARDRMRLRAGGEWMRTTLAGDDHQFALNSAEEALTLDAALQRLESIDERAARVVELTCFAGVTQEQAAKVLGVARRTIVRDWRFACAYLKNELG